MGGRSRQSVWLFRAQANGERDLTLSQSEGNKLGPRQNAKEEKISLMLLCSGGQRYALVEGDRSVLAGEGVLDSSLGLGDRVRDGLSRVVEEVVAEGTGDGDTGDDDGRTDGVWRDMSASSSLL